MSMPKVIPLVPAVLVIMAHGRLCAQEHQPFTGPAWLTVGLGPDPVLAVIPQDFSMGGSFSWGHNMKYQVGANVLIDNSFDIGTLPDIFSVFSGSVGRARGGKHYLLSAFAGPSIIGISRSSARSDFWDWDSISGGLVVNAQALLLPRIRFESGIGLDLIGVISPAGILVSSRVVMTLGGRGV